MTDLNGGALFNAEFGIRHRGSTVPERSGVALSFCRRQDLIFTTSKQRQYLCTGSYHWRCTSAANNCKQEPGPNDR
jgi:hypothetical protein